jgi:hypothetical protein
MTSLAVLTVPAKSHARAVCCTLQCRRRRGLGKNELTAIGMTAAEGPAVTSTPDCCRFPGESRAGAATTDVTDVR